MSLISKNDRMIFFAKVHLKHLFNHETPTLQIPILRAFPHHHIVPACTNPHRITLSIPPFQFLAVQIERYLNTLSGRNADTFKSTQSLARSFCVILLLEVNLHRHADRYS